MKLRALLSLLALAVPIGAAADIQIQCAPAPAPPPPTRFDWMIPKGVKLPGRGANWTNGYIGRLWLKGLRSYSTTGRLPDTADWKYLRRQYNRNPGAFNARHPYLQGLFTPPGTIGSLPDGKFWDNLTDQHNDRPNLFDHRYPYLAEILDRDELTKTEPPAPPDVQPPPVAPPPNPSVTGPPSGGGGSPPIGTGPGVPNPPPGPNDGRPSGGGPSGPPSVGFVPEPASIVMTTTGLGALALIARRLRRRSDDQTQV